MIYTEPTLVRRAYKEQLKKIKVDKTWPICKSVPTKYWGCSWSQSGFPTILSIIEVGDVVVGTILALVFQRDGECRMVSFFVGFIGVYVSNDFFHWRKVSWQLQASYHVFTLETVPIRTVNRQCSLGLQAVVNVAAAIKAGCYDIGM